MSGPVVEVIQAWLSIKVHDRDGQVIQSREMQSESPVRAFLEAFLSMVIATGVTTVDIAAGADTVGPAVADLLNSTGPANDATQGIVVGTGVAAVDIADDSLQTQIAEGTGSGQLTHELQTDDAQVTTEVGTVWFDITRQFTNGSGATIKIFESGIYGLNGQAGAADLCWIHDVFAPLYLPDGLTATIRYRLRIIL